MNMKIKLNGLSMQNLALVAIFLATLNTVNRYYYFIFIAFGLAMLCKDFKVFVNGSLFALMLLALSLILFAGGYTYSILGILKSFTFALCYVMGYGLCSYKEGSSNKGLKFFYMLCGFTIAGTFGHYLLNWVNNYSTYKSRNTIDFWTGMEFSATGQAAMASAAVALAIACIFTNAGMKVKFVSALAILLAFGYNLILAGRTILIMGIVIFGVAFFNRLICEKKGILKTIFILTVIVIIVVTIYSYDFMGVKSAVESSQLYDRFTGIESEELEEDSRMARKLQYLKHGVDYMFGGANLRSMYGHAHDIFLDTYDEAGIFALIAMVSYMLASVLRLIRCVKAKSDKLTFEFKQIVLCLYVVLYMQFMIEPILQGMPWLFASFCIIDGAVSRIIRDNAL